MQARDDGRSLDAIIDFAWSNSLAVSGDKTGIIAFWDVNTGQAIRLTKGHGTAVGKVSFYQDDA